MFKVIDGNLDFDPSLSFIIKGLAETTTEMVYKINKLADYYFSMKCEQVT